MNLLPTKLDLKNYMYTRHFGRFIHRDTSVYYHEYYNNFTGFKNTAENSILHLDRFVGDKFNIKLSITYNDKLYTDFTAMYMLSTGSRYNFILVTTCGLYLLLTIYGRYNYEIGKINTSLYELDDIPFNITHATNDIVFTDVPNLYLTVKFIKHERTFIPLDSKPKAISNDNLKIVDNELYCKGKIPRIGVGAILDEGYISEDWILLDNSQQYEYILDHTINDDNPRVMLKTTDGSVYCLGRYTDIPDELYIEENE
jgi:hypothetical protein